MSPTDQLPPLAVMDDGPVRGEIQDVKQPENASSEIDHRVFIATPLRSSVEGEHHEFVMQLMSYDRSNKKQIGHYRSSMAGSAAGAFRNQLAMEFIHTKLEWLLFFDSDVATSDLRIVEKLLETADPVERPIVTGVYLSIDSMGDGSVVPVIYNWGWDKELNRPHFIPKRDFDPGETEPYKIDAAGCGCLLIHRSVLERMFPINPIEPFFGGDILNGAVMGEDFTFFYRTRMLGIATWCDPKVQVLHKKPVLFDPRGYKPCTQEDRVMLEMSVITPEDFEAAEQQLKETKELVNDNV